MPAPAPSTAARDKVRTIAPKLVDLTEKVLFGDVWERPGLSKRDRSLITVATLVALNRSEQLRGTRRSSYSPARALHRNQSGQQLFLLLG